MNNNSEMNEKQSQSKKSKRVPSLLFNSVIVVVIFMFFVFPNLKESQSIPKEIDAIHRYNALPITQNDTIITRKSNNTITNISQLSSHEKSNVINKNLPMPDQMLQQYIKWHSKDALEDNDIHHRKYVIGYYQCPLQAGSRFHNFLTSLIVAIALNRTLLYKYLDQETCLRTTQGSNMEICYQANTIQDCHKILHRASWIPSLEDDYMPLYYHYYHHHYLFNNYSKTEMMTNKNHKNNDYNNNNMSEIFRPRRQRLKQDQGMRAVQELFFNDPGRPYQTDIRSHDKYKEFQFAKQVDGYTQRVEQLYSLGADYLYGMLFHNTFTINPKYIPPEYKPNSNNNDNQEQYSYFIHSRHPFVHLNGTKIDVEKECLDKFVFEFHKQPTKNNNNCTIYVLADRQVSLDLLSNYINNHSPCKPVIASHALGSGLNPEHGPFAGIGYFQDLLVASQTNQGWMGKCRRTSTELVREAAIYQLFKKNYNHNNNIKKYPNLDYCCWNSDNPKDIVLQRYSASTS